MASKRTKKRSGADFTQGRIDYTLTPTQLRDRYGNTMPRAEFQKSLNKAIKATEFIGGAGDHSFRLQGGKLAIGCRRFNAENTQRILEWANGAKAKKRKKARGW